MSDTFSKPDSIDRSANTAWARFQSTREWLAVMFFFWMLFSLMFGAVVLFSDESGFLYYLWALVGQAGRTIILLMGVQSALGWGLCLSFFGTKAQALILSCITGVLWFFAFLLFVSTFQGVSHVNQFLIGTMIPSIFLLIPGLSIFFLTYLLWRTNNET